MKKRFTKGLILGLLTLFSVSSINSANIAFFADNNYTDMDPDCGNEGFGMRQTLIAQGHTVTSFTGITAADFTAAVAGQDILYFPEMEDGDLAADLSNAAITVISDYVNNGGGLMLNGGTGFGAGTESEELLNAIFGFALGPGGFFNSGSSALNAAMAVGTAFEGGPASVPTLSGTHVLTATLPPLTKCIYERTPTQTTVGLIPFGNGRIVFIGWDWYEGGPGCSDQSAAWDDVVGRGIAEILASAGAPAAVPTMGEWGLIILALLVLSFGTVFMMRRQTAFAGAGNVSVSGNSGIPFDKGSFAKMLAGVMVALAAVFTVAVLAFGYEMTSADLPGSLIAAPIAAYLLHLVFSKK